VSTSTTTPTTIGDVARLVRSKNAGPFWLTLDVFCDDEASYRQVARDDVLDRGRIAAAYAVEPASIRVFLLPDLLAVKVSFPRPVAQGSVHDRDVHAGQQHVPLARLPLAPS